LQLKLKERAKQQEEKGGAAVIMDNEYDIEI